MSSTDGPPEQVPGDDEGQGNLACCSPWGHKESDMTDQLVNNKPFRCVFLIFCDLNGDSDEEEKRGTTLHLHYNWYFTMYFYSHYFIQYSKQNT